MHATVINKFIGLSALNELVALQLKILKSREVLARSSALRIRDVELLDLVTAQLILLLVAKRLACKLWVPNHASCLKMRLPNLSSKIWKTTAMPHADINSCAE